MNNLIRNEKFEYQRNFGKISAYITTYNCINGNYPFVESILSTLGFASETVVLDGCSTDGTYEILEKLASENSKIKLYQNEFDWSEPGIDGMQKAYARALCENEFLWQMDCDEVVNENDYEKIKMITKRFPTQADILHLPVIEIWDDENNVTGRRHAWKWRFSRNKPEITHAINKYARITDEKTGKVYAKEGMSDGCEYVNVMSYEPLPHVGFWTQNMELERIHSQEAFAKTMNKIFKSMPSVYHYSWFNIERKINQLKKGGTWDKLWALLYQKETMKRFPEVETEEQINTLVKKLSDHGGEDSDQVKYKFELKRSNPTIMKNWIEKFRRTK